MKESHILTTCGENVAREPTPEWSGYTALQPHQAPSPRGKMTGPDVSERCHCKASKPATTKPNVVSQSTLVNYRAIRCDTRSRTCPQQYHVTATTIFAPARATPTARRIDSLVQDHRRSTRGRIQNRIDHLYEKSHRCETPVRS
mgnify:CR=1 FL=1